MRGIVRCGFDEYITAECPDILCLQETKFRHESDADRFRADIDYRYFPYRYYHCDRMDQHSGTAILSRVEPRRVWYGFRQGNWQHAMKDREGRVLAAEFDRFILVTVHVPHAHSSLEKLQYKLEWMAAFQEHVQRLREMKPVIIAGDFNIALSDLDADPKFVAETPELVYCMVIRFN